MTKHEVKDIVLGGAVFFGVFVGIPLFAENFLVDKGSSSYSEEITEPTEEITPIDNSEYVEKRGTADCTQDCSGHDAGYEWAEKYTICDTEYNNGNSESFNEGVRQWAEDNCYYSDGSNPI